MDLRLQLHQGQAATHKAHNLFDIDPTIRESPVDVRQPRHRDWDVPSGSSRSWFRHKHALSLLYAFYRWSLTPGYLEISLWNLLNQNRLALSRLPAHLNSVERYRGPSGWHHHQVSFTDVCRAFHSASWSICNPCHAGNRSQPDLSNQSCLKPGAGFMNRWPGRGLSGIRPAARRCGGRVRWGSACSFQRRRRPGTSECSAR